VAAHSLEPIAPTLAALAALALAALGATVAVACRATACNPPLPAAFDSRAVSPASLAVGVLCLWFWAAVFVRRERRRRGSLQAALLPANGEKAALLGRDIDEDDAALDAERRRQERAIVTLRFVDGLADSIPSVALRQFAVQARPVCPAEGTSPRPTRGAGLVERLSPPRGAAATTARARRLAGQPGRHLLDYRRAPLELQFSVHSARGSYAAKISCHYHSTTAGTLSEFRTTAAKNNEPISVRPARPSSPTPSRSAAADACRTWWSASSARLWPGG
jgi:hypothetical protein